jgi:RNA polymerase sigma-70 factor (ECF subfamily)
MNTKLVWETYADDVKRFIFSKTKNKDVTNDLVQEVFIKVHTKITTLQKVELLKSWLFTIAKNTVLDHYRSSQKKVNTEQDNIEIVDEDTPILNEHSEEDCLYGIVTKLPKKYRDPLFMSDIKGMKQAVIADVLKLPLPTVKSQIQRARKMIAQGYMNCCGFELNDKGFLVGEIKSKDGCKVCY